MKDTAAQMQRITGGYSIRGYAGRMRVYLREMFPLPIRIAQALLFGSSFLLLLHQVSGVGDVVFGVPSLVAVLDIFLLTLLLRLMDELKDREIDRRLFPARPVPSGRVYASDIVITLAAVSKIYVAVNLSVGSIAVPALLVLGYAFLMYFHFFAPNRHRRSLILSLATHNPITGLMLVLLAAGFAASNDSTLRSLPVMPVAGSVIMYWSLVASWEMARKVRSPESETRYVTYSRLLGYRRAAVIVLSIQSIPVAVGAWLTLYAGLSLLLPVILGAAYGFVLCGHIRFLRRPSTETNRLRTYAELYMLLVCLAPFGELVMRQGQGG